MRLPAMVISFHDRPVDQAMGAARMETTNVNAVHRRRRPIVSSEQRVQRDQRAICADSSA
jgi:hypothetical protein